MPRRKEEKPSVEPYPWRERVYMPHGFALLQSRRAAVEICGLSNAGKSSLIEELNKSGLEGTKLIVMPELKMEGLQTTITRRDVKVLSELGLEWETLSIEEMKLDIWSQLLDKINTAAVDNFARGDNTPVVGIAERGVNDALAYILWMLQVASGKQEASYPQWDEVIEDGAYFDHDRYTPYKFMEEWRRIFSFGWSLAHSTTAVILFGVSQEETERRRIAQGLPAEGDIANRKHRPLFEQSYGWWLGTVFPQLNQRMGTGLLVVDGNKPLSENNLKIKRFLQRIPDLKG